MVMDITRYRKHACALLNGDLPDDALESTDFWTMSQADGIFPVLWSGLTQEQQEKAKPKLLHPMDERILVTDALRMRNATARILRAYREANIPIICLRGLAISETLYPHSYLRPHTDIDILFEPKFTLLAKQVAGNALHYRPLRAYPMLFKQGDIPLDLHTEPLGADRIKAWKEITPLDTSDFFKHSYPGKLAGESALLVHDRLLLPYLCFHALKHSFERLTWLYDIALLCRDIDKQQQWPQVLEGIHEYHLERPCYYALSYVKKHLGASVPDSLLEEITPEMGFVEKRLFARHMKHQVIPYFAERLFSRMMPSLGHKIEFWRETIYPDVEVREQIAGGGCVKCNFIRKRLKQIVTAAWALSKEVIYITRS